MTATMAEIREEVAVNPDAQSAVTDFLDYTEYLPTDLIRSLTLIQQLDETYLENADAINDFSQIYGSLPSVPLSERPDATTVRSNISRHLDLALGARESAYAEAVRLFDLTDRHQDRLRSIIAKLTVLPKPPSRDPTPQPQAPTSIKRSKAGRRLDSTTIPRLTLKPPKGTVATTILARPRHRRITVPGEVQPPYDPDEPIASTEVSDWDSEPLTPPRPPPQLKVPKVAHREIATYRKPTPPPDDAVLGSKWRPWTRLSEYEMYKLRKKMKKNHTWEPSEVMIRRELAEKGRGWDHYWKAKADAQASGRPFLDIDTVPDKSPAQPPTQPPLKTEASKPTPKPEAISRPKSLKRSHSRKDRDRDKDKEKREETPRDPASLAAQEAELAARRLGDIGSAFKNLFSPFSSALASLKTATSTPTPVPAKPELKVPKKRKWDDPSPASPTLDVEAQARKRPKILPKPSPLTASDFAPAPIISAGTIRIPTNTKIPPLKLSISQPVPLASNTPSSAQISRPASAPRLPSVTAKLEPSPPSSRPPSRRSAAAATAAATIPAVDSVTIAATRSSARTSTTPSTSKQKTPVVEETPKAVAPPAQTLASRRGRRDAPGTVTQTSQDGGAAVSVSIRGKPKNPDKAQIHKPATSPKPELRIDIDGTSELVDPDEEKYCICGDVSWGEMICCELDDKCEYGQWFHLECVKIHELLPRTVKWYCPTDRKRLRKGERSNGLVGRGIGS